MILVGHNNSQVLYQRKVNISNSRARKIVLNVLLAVCKYVFSAEFYAEFSTNGTC